MLKLYVPETDSAYFLDLLEQSSAPILSSTIAATEILTAAYGKESVGDANPGSALSVSRRFSEHCTGGLVTLVPYTEDVTARAAEIVRESFERDRVRLGALDAIHVASAVVAHAHTLVATDKRMRQAASMLHFRLLPD